MSLLLISTLALSGPVQSACSWDRPGINPFMGDVVAAVDRYKDIPAEVRNRLKQRVALRRYDELVTIKRDSIAGAYDYADLRDMHFGQGSICQTVTRARWTDAMQERGLVYCEDGHCLIVPTVCRNVSRITRVPHRQARSDGPSGPPERSNLPPLDLPFAAGGPDELQFEAPGAGSGPSFASLSQEDPVALPLSPIPAVAASNPAGPSHSGARDGSWLGFAGHAWQAVPALFAWGAAAARTALQVPPPAVTGLPGVPGVPGIQPPLSAPPAPLVETSPTPQPPVIVSVPTVLPPTEISLTSMPPVAPASAPPGPVVQVVPVPNLPGDPALPLLASVPGVPNVPPAAPPATVPLGASFNPGDLPISATPVPEPSTLFLLGLGLVLVVWNTRRKGLPLAVPAGAVSRE